MGLNSSARLSFPITVARKARLLTTGKLNLAIGSGAFEWLA